jgi:hypothetical protein
MLVVHGLIVGAQSSGSFTARGGVANPSWVSWWPTALGQSWLLSRFGLERSPLAWVAGVLWIAGGILLVAAGLAVFGVLVPQGLWRPLATAGAVVSLFLLIVYLHPLLGVGMLADVAILVALVWAHWPQAAWIGA